MELSLPGYVREMIGMLEGAGFEAYAVGGCVRDLLRGTEPHDFDVTTGALPDETSRIFAGRRVIGTGIKHGTVTVLADGGEPVEITTFRVDGEYLDNRHPASVSFTRRLEDDLSRRDFTVNAMAYSPSRGLVDLFGGLRHLDQRVIACVGEPSKRFAEDGLRILRALRFAAVLGFSIAPETARAVHESRGLLRGISAERICAELSRLLCGTNAAGILAEYPDAVLAAFPALEPLEAAEEGHLVRAAGAIGNAPPVLAVRLALLLRGFDAESAAAALRSLRFDNRTITDAAAAAGALGEPLGSGRVFARELAHRFGYERARMLLDARAALAAAEGSDTDAENIESLRAALLTAEADGDCVTLRQLAISGEDMTALGFSGRGVGEMLEQLLGEVIAERLPNERAALLTFAANNV